MAAYKDSIGFSKGTAAPNAAGVYRNSYLDTVINIPEIQAARKAIGVPELAAGDTLEVIPVKKNMVVFGVGIEVEVAQGSAQSVQIGDSADPNGWVTTADGSLNTVGVQSSFDETAGYSAGKLYKSNTSIRLLFSAKPTNAIFRVFAFTGDCSKAGA